MRISVRFPITLLNGTSIMSRLYFQAVGLYCLASPFIFQLVWTQNYENPCRCALPGVPVQFKTCASGPADYRTHDHPDIGLTGDCLPDIPVK